MLYCLDLLEVKIKLVYPPSSYVDMPPLGVASLKAYAEQKLGVKVSNWDWNLEFLEFLLQKPLLLQTLHASVPREQKPFFLKAIAQLPQAKKTFSDPQRYYVPQKFNDAMAVVRANLELYSRTDEVFNYYFSANGFSMHLKNFEESYDLKKIITLLHSNAFPLLQHHLEKSLFKGEPVDLLGISCSSLEQLLPSLVLAQFVKKHALAKTVVLGGSYVTTIKSLFLETPEVFKDIDFAVPYEGEFVFTELIEFLQSKRNLVDVSGILYVKDNQVKTHLPKKISDLNQLPTPDFSDFSLDHYWTCERVLPTYASRGCYFDLCKFCNHHENYYGSFRVRSPEKVIEDLTFYEHTLKATKYFFCDELISPNGLLQISRLIQKNHLNAKWYAHCRVDEKITKSDLHEMAKGGLTLIHVGVESANDEILEAMQKGYHRKEVEQFLENLAEVPMTAHLNTIRGYPGETKDQYIETLEVMHTHAKVGDFIHLYEFGLIRNAPLQKEGHPNILKQYPQKNRLKGDVAFERMEAESYDFSIEERRLKRRLSGDLQRGMGLYPSQFNWAAHLLYVSHLREQGQGAVLDQRLRAYHFSEPRFFEVSTPKQSVVFFPHNHRFLNVAEDVIETFNSEVDPEDFEMDSNVSYVLDDLNIGGNQNTVLSSPSPTLYLNVSNGCNLSCVYCYANKGKYTDSEKPMSFATAQKAIERFYEENLTISRLVFFGGEPLLQFKLIEQVVAWVKTFAENLNVPAPGFLMITNGTLINENIAKFLKQENFSITVSLDGPENIHDFLRPDVFENPSFNRVKKGIDLLQAVGLSVNIEATFTKKHFEMGVKPLDVVKFVQNLNVRSMTLAPMGGQKEDPLKLTGDELLEEYLNALDYALESLKTDHPIALSVSSLISGWLSQAGSRPDHQYCYTELGKDTFAVSSSGEIFPCQMFNGQKEFSMGTVFEPLTLQKKFLEVQQKFEQNKKSLNKCNSCFAKKICFVCPAGIALETHDPEMIPEHRCRLTHEIAKKVILFEARKEAL